MDEQEIYALEDYDYNQHTGELCDIFGEECDEECDEESYEECDDEDFDSESSEQPLVKNTKLKYLNRLFEIHSEAATKYGIELKSYIFRKLDDELALYLEFVSIAEKISRKDLEVNVVVYDKEGDVICTKLAFLTGRTFTGFEVISFSFYDLLPSHIGRVVLYFKKD